MILKVCPVLLRGRGDAMDILAFRHPLAGTQIVKGTVEPGEGLEAAAVREMQEESGLVVTIDRPLGQLDLTLFHETWHIFLCQSASRPDRPLPDHWQHRAEDDGGLSEISCVGHDDASGGDIACHDGRSLLSRTIY